MRSTRNARKASPTSSTPTSAPRTTLARADNAWDHIFGDENRQPRYASALIYWPILGLMAFAEVPVNRLSFELFFGESPTIMFVVAALVGAIFMCFAHGLGIVSRQFRYHVEKARGPMVATGQLVVMTAFVLALSYGVAVFRQAYLNFATTPDPSFAELMRTQQIGQAAIAAAQETPKSDITGTIAQWTKHPPGGRPFTSVYVFSDMLENSQALPWHQFQMMAVDKVVEATNRYKLSPAVSKADVHIVGFGRLHTLGRPMLPADLDARLRETWAAYFNAGGAQSVNFEGAIRK
jgi:hypothetical protein